MLFHLFAALSTATEPTDLITITETHQVQSHWHMLADPVPSVQSHEVVFAIKQDNLDELEHELFSRSTPGNIKYGQHLSFDEVGSMISTSMPAKRTLEWLKEKLPHMQVVKSSPRGEYIRIAAPVGELEAALHADFSYYRSAKTNKVALRCASYKLPKAVAAVFHTVDFPATLRNPPKAVKKSEAASAWGLDKNGVETPTNLITPAVLNSFYKIGSNAGSSDVSQGVFETGGQTYSPENLQEFQTHFDLPSQTVATDVGGHANNFVCELDSNECAEANLDVQYMMAVSQKTPMTFFYESDETDPFVAFVEAIAAEKSPPDVNSISYGSLESEIAKSTMDAFNTEAMKLGTMGVSIFVSSGDDGVANFGVTSTSQCAYNPSYPATSPYVTAVGATYSSSWATPGEGEIVCQSNLHDAVITSGGGFSTVYAAPSYQASAIKGYFDTVETQPKAGYSTTGRGYPDVALSGFGYEVVIGEDLMVLCGTSCSSPSVGGMVSLVNAIRVEAGSTTLGFLNPALYKAGEASGAFNDVTSGENQCTADAEVCCSEGFYAAKGWDPTTGFGSVDFSSFKAQFTSDLDPDAVAAAEARLAARAASVPAAAPAAKPATAAAPAPVEATPSDEAEPRPSGVQPWDMPPAGAAPWSPFSCSDLPEGVSPSCRSDLCALVNDTSVVGVLEAALEESLVLNHAAVSASHFTSCTLGDGQSAECMNVTSSFDKSSQLSAMTAALAPHKAYSCLVNATTLSTFPTAASTNGIAVEHIGDSSFVFVSDSCSAQDSALILAKAQKNCDASPWDPSLKMTCQLSWANAAGCVAPASLASSAASPPSPAAAKAVASPTADVGAAAPSAGPSDPSGGFPVSAIAGVAVALVGAAGVVGAGGFYVKSRRRAASEPVLNSATLYNAIA